MSARTSDDRLKNHMCVHDGLPWERCVPRVTECPCTVNQFRHATFVHTYVPFGVKESGVRWHTKK
jgi:hypothetical protein